MEKYKVNREQLVMVHTTFLDENGTMLNRIGTGYFVTPNLVLTANHVFPSAQVTAVRVRVEESGTWLKAYNKPAWQATGLDAALIRTTIDHPGVSVDWKVDPWETDQHWSSTGYPDAARTEDVETSALGSQGLRGELFWEGGKGQNKIHHLDLTVKSPPTPPEKWSGISGAPIMIEGKLSGIIKSVPKYFTDRLAGVPAYELFKDAAFKAAIQGNIYTIPSDDNWAIVLASEKADEERLRNQTSAAFSECFGQEFKTIFINITEVLKTPGDLLNFIPLLCKAPLMIIDVTGFQPGIMMIMGIRAVVRRGVTIVTTNSRIDEKHLIDLPFNIREIKLVILHHQFQTLTASTAKDRLITAIREGRTQLDKSPGYLDLPPYDAVRNPAFFDNPLIEKRMLMLCPFNDAYASYFTFIRDNFANLVSQTSTIVRMLDIGSPQLIGQSLYEHIRWASICAIDWSFWRPNVFYELGVRLASSDKGLINIIERTHRDPANIPVPNLPSGLDQYAMLNALFSPISYDFEQEIFPDTIQKKYKYFESLGKTDAPDTGQAGLQADNIYSQAEKNFDWAHEHQANKPHLAIRRQLEREFGNDRQARGQYNILYSANRGYKTLLQQQIREYWLCAWYYVLNRYDIEQLKDSPAIREELIAIGEATMEALDLEEYKKIKNDILDIIDEFEKP